MSSKNVRLVAWCNEVYRPVNVTLRNKMTDLTDVNLSAPAYTHYNSKTVSGKVGINPSSGYYFVPNN